MKKRTIIATIATAIVAGISHAEWSAPLVRVSGVQVVVDQKFTKIWAKASADCMTASFYVASVSAPAAINWGDGTTTTHSSAGNVSHTYASAGDYLVTIPQTVTSVALWLDDASKLSVAKMYTRFESDVDGMDIGNLAFRESERLETVVLPDGVRFGSDGYTVFYNSSVREITCRSSTPPALSANGLSGAANLVSIKVPAESVDAYKAATGWSAKASIITAL